MRLIIITLLLLFYTDVNAVDIQFGLFTKHLYQTNPCKGDTNCTFKPLNEDNKVVTLFSNYSLGIGTMINSYERRSYMLMYRFGHTLPLFTKEGIHTKLWVVTGLVSGYTDVPPFETNVVPIVSTSLSFYKQNKVVSIGLSAPSVIIITAGFKF